MVDGEVAVLLQRALDLGWQQKERSAKNGSDVKSSFWFVLMKSQGTVASGIEN